MKSLRLQALSLIPLFPSLPEVVRLPTEEVCAAQVVRAVRVVEAAGDLVLGQADA